MHFANSPGSSCLFARRPDYPVDSLRTSMRRERVSYVSTPGIFDQTWEHQILVTRSRRESKSTYAAVGNNVWPRCDILLKRVLSSKLETMSGQDVPVLLNLVLHEITV